MTHKSHDVGVSKHIGYYSDAVEAAPGRRWLYTSGTPGLRDDGSVPPTFEEQARLAWRNVFAALEAAGMTTEDIVKVTASVVNAADIPEYVNIRRELLGSVKPALMLSVVTQLIKPGILVEIELVAAAR
jgi:enamine deaminase RidA (YjgF/YER057c/UK114 family)